MIVDGRGRFMSQRRFSKLALISPSLPKTKDEVGAVRMMLKSVRTMCEQSVSVLCVVLFGSLPCGEDGMHAVSM